MDIGDMMWIVVAVLLAWSAAAGPPLLYMLCG